MEIGYQLTDFKAFFFQIRETGGTKELQDFETAGTFRRLLPTEIK
jgi:hypothetical protein